MAAEEACSWEQSRMPYMMSDVALGEEQPKAGAKGSKGSKGSKSGRSLLSDPSALAGDGDQAVPQDSAMPTSGPPGGAANMRASTCGQGDIHEVCARGGTLRGHGARSRPCPPCGPCGPCPLRPCPTPTHTRTHGGHTAKATEAATPASSFSH